MSDPIADLRPGPRPNPRIFVESWSAAYGSPVHFDQEDDDRDTAETALIEGEGFAFVAPAAQELPPIAFIDGVRQQEAALSQMVDGRPVGGLAGAYAVGAVLANTGQTARYLREDIHRVVIWPKGLKGPIPSHRNGWIWNPETTIDTTAMGPMNRLQELMRIAEAALADELARAGYLVLLDGTLSYAWAYQQNRIAGYVKTHHRRLLPEAEATKLPSLPTGYRTTLFRVNDKRYSCYLRLNDHSPWHSPMSGIVRLEFAGGLPIDDARLLADGFSSLLPQYAGIPHVDPRAPQNLQPTGALEKHLRHLMGQPTMAERAVRDVIALQTPEVH